MTPSPAEKRTFIGSAIENRRAARRSTPFSMSPSAFCNRGQKLSSLLALCNAFSAICRPAVPMFRFGTGGVRCRMHGRGLTSRFAAARMGPDGAHRNIGGDHRLRHRLPNPEVPWLDRPYEACHARKNASLPYIGTGPPHFRHMAARFDSPAENLWLTSSTAVFFSRVRRAGSKRCSGPRLSLIRALSGSCAIRTLCLGARCTTKWFIRWRRLCTHGTSPYCDSTFAVRGSAKARMTVDEGNKMMSAPLSLIWQKNFRDFRPCSQGSVSAPGLAYG